MLLVLFIYISPLQVKNKPHDRDTKHSFTLLPISLVANRRSKGASARKKEG
jgi:hypothetical protein